MMLYKAIPATTKYLEAMAMISLQEVLAEITLIVVRVLTQLLTFSQVLIQRQQTVKIVRHSYHYKVSF